MKHRLWWLFLLSVVTVLFFWKILLTGQFSMLLEYEGANQAYSWYHFSAASIQKGILPLWDPYTHSGRSFVGEMQTGLFYPLKLILYFWPLKPAEPFSERLFHVFFVFAHLLAAGFMFLLAEELGLRRFSAFVAAICFGLGGFVGKTMWPDMVDSAIWLPLIFLFLIHALRAGPTGRGLMYACLAGLSLGMSVLGGRLHIPMMNGLVVVSAAMYYQWEVRNAECGISQPHSALRTPHSALRNPLLWGALVVAIVAGVAFAFGAIQLLPSMEYSKLAIRALGGDLALPARQKIPYAHLNDGFLPRSIFAFVLAYPFDGNIGQGEVSPYFGVLPSFLVVIGAWRNWSRVWVRYLAGLAVLSWVYTLGSFSLLHGLLYALVPYLWMGREAGRFIYLTHFAMAILAGFGVRALFSGEEDEALARLHRPLKWIVMGIVTALAIQAIIGQPPVNDWSYYALLFILGTYAVFVQTVRGRRTAAIQALVVALILFDFGGTHWIIRNKAKELKEGTNHLAALLDCRNLADFLKSQPGLFRVDITAEWAPNIGDLYGIQTTGGMSATELEDHGRFFRLERRAFDLLNVRYMVKKTPEPAAKPVYENGPWKVYENGSYFPRAWVVHSVELEPSPDRLLDRLKRASFDPLHVALIGRPLETGLEPAVQGETELVTFREYRGDRLELRVHARSRALLVLSEIDYPGWRATVNGQSARIHRADGLLRGIIVPPGESTIVFRYAPRSVMAGALLTAASFFAVFVLCLVVLKKEKGASHGNGKAATGSATL